MGQDRIIKAMTDDGTIRILLATTANLVEEARLRHNTSPTATAALGRVLTITVMMGTDLKGDESVTVRINGGGPLGTVLAVSDGDGTVRGYVANPSCEVPEKYRGKLDVGKAVGQDGFVEVIKDLGMKVPFSGRVRLVSGEIAEDMAYYFTYSEQVPSLVSLGVYIGQDLSVKAAGGMLIQALPGADEDQLAVIEERVQNMKPLTSLLLETTLEGILEEVLAGIPYHIMAEMPLAFKCRCSREKAQAILAAMSEEDVQKAAEGRGLVEIVCNFCNETYRFPVDENKPNP